MKCLLFVTPPVTLEGSVLFSHSVCDSHDKHGSFTVMILTGWSL